MISEIRNMNYDEAPDMIAILLCVMLFKLGGQVTITLGELEQIHREFPTIRFALLTDAVNPSNLAQEQLTCTLLAHDHVNNDRPKEKL